jgi:DNA-binding response OmpR family regulator
MHHLLLIDDDVELTDMLSAYLGREGFTLTVCHDGAEASAMLADSAVAQPDLVVLDVMLPTLDGFGVLRALRDRGQSPPVLMLTARGDDDDRIAGLELGADDYLSKPFNPRELVARLRAILRRVGEAPEEGTLTVGELVLDPSRIEARLHGQHISLTGAEFRVLQMLVQQVGRVVSRADLTDHALGRKLELYDRSIDTHVSNLRRKLNLTDQSGLEIRGVRGVGYQMTRPTEN